jgi:hypothetical protein
MKLSLIQATIEHLESIKAWYLNCLIKHSIKRHLESRGRSNKFNKIEPNCIIELTIEIITSSKFLIDL